MAYCLLHVISFLGLTFLVKKAFSIAIEIAPIVTISLVILVLVAFGLVDISFLNLKKLYLIITLLGILSLAGFSTQFIRKKYNYLDYINFNLLLYLGLLFLFYFVTIHEFVHHADDVNYWASIVRYIHITNHLPTQSAPFEPIYMSYTPGVALWINLFLSLKNTISENIIFLAQSCLIFSGLLTITINKKPREAIVAFFIGFVIIFLVNAQAFNNLVVDEIISLWFFAIVYYVSIEKNLLRSIWTMAPLILVLFFIKDVGALFATLALTLMAWSIWYKNKLFSSQKKLQCFISLVALILLIFTFRYLWLQHIIAFGFHSYMNSQFRLKYYFSAENYTAIIKNFIHYLGLLLTGKFHDNRFDASYSLLVSVFLITLCWIGIFYNTKTKAIKKYYRYLLYTLIVFALIYAIGVYLFEIRAFPGSVEKNIFPEAARYFTIFMLGFMLISFGLYSQFLTQWNNPLVYSLQSLFCIALIALLITGITHHTNTQAKYVRKVANIISAQTPSNEKTTICYIAFTHEQYNSAQIIKHLIIPRHMISFIMPENSSEFLRKLAKCQYIMKEKNQNHKAKLYSLSQFLTIENKNSLRRKTNQI